MPEAGALDLVLVNPGGRSRVYQELGAELAAVEPPVWAGMMAEFVRRHGFSVAILDANAEGLDARAAAERIAELSPRLVAVVVYGHQPSASTQNMPAAGAVCTALKQVGGQWMVLLVGGHVAALPEQTLRQEDADAVCDGEGPYTILDLLGVLNAGGGSLGTVRGLWYREGHEIGSNASAPLIEDLDREMPGVAWDLLPMDRYRAHNWHCFGGLPRQPYAAMYTTLGCPFKCSFCCIQAPFRRGEHVLGYRSGTNSYRRWSPQAVVAQIDTLVAEYGVRNIKIADEIFVLNSRHIEAICDALIERRYDLNMWAYARVDTLRKGLVDKLKRAGINWLALGIEAATPTVLEDARKAYAQNRVGEAVRTARAAGIHIIGNYIFGLPEDTAQSMQATLDLALELRCEFANFYCAMAYPGSALYDEALREGIPLPQTWAGYSQHSVDTLPLATRHLSSAEVLRFRDEAFHTYFSDPGYLAMIEGKFGGDTRLGIERMSAKRLERRYA